MINTTPRRCTDKQTISGNTRASLPKRPGRFLWRVIKGFKRNQGLLLSGAVAYYGLLSIVPLLALLLVGRSHFIPEEVLLTSVRNHLDFILSVSADALTSQIAKFLKYRKVSEIVDLPINKLTMPSSYPGTHDGLEGKRAFILPILL